MPADMKELTSVDKEGWKAELPLIREHFAIFGDRLPKALQRRAQRAGEAARLIAHHVLMGTTEAAPVRPRGLSSFLHLPGVRQTARRTR